MQNYILISNHIDNKIPYDIRSEILYREAEDCFFYFSKTKDALKKLTKALELYPFHFKSLVLKGDILFCQGNYDEALKFYIDAMNVHSQNPKVLGAIANCLNELEFYNDAELFCDKALSLSQHDDLYSSLYELKIKILMNLKEYSEVKNLLNNSFVFRHDNLTTLKQIISKTIKTKIDLRKRIQKVNLRAI